MVFENVHYSVLLTQFYEHPKAYRSTGTRENKLKCGRNKVGQRDKEGKRHRETEIHTSSGLNGPPDTGSRCRSELTLLPIHTEH